MKVEQIKINKNTMQVLSGAFLITLVLLLNGFLSFITVGFDFSKLGTAEYWGSFAVTLASELVVLFGAYLVQKTKDIQNKKIVELQTDVAEKRDIVYALDKVTEAEEWLREIYNYKERLNLFEDKIKAMYERLNLRKPETFERNYEIKLQKYEKAVAKKEFLLKQMEYIKKDKQRLALLVEKNSDKAKIEELTAELSTDEYKFKTAKIKYRDVYWGNLLADIDETSKRDNSVFFSEKAEVSKSMIRYIGGGLIGSAFISSLVYPAINGIGWDFLINMITMLVALCIFMTRGIALSKRTILGRYYKSLEKRKAIYNKMLKDLGVSKIKVVDSIDK